MAAAALLGLSVATTAHAYSPADELRQRSGMAEQAGYWLRTSDFEKLGGMTTAYRQELVGTHSGYPYLTAVHDGLEFAINEQEPGGQLDKMLTAATAWFDEKPDDPGRSVALAAMRLAAAQHRLDLEDGADSAQNRYLAAIGEVHSFLEGQRATAATNPHFYALMVRIAIAESAAEATIEALAEQGAKAFPNYPTPLLIVAEHLATRKNAKAEDIEAFARKAGDWLGGSTGDALYARIYLHITEAVYGTGVIKSTKLDWPHMTAGITALATINPTGGWNRSGFAMMSCVAGDQQKTAELITPIYDDGMVPPDQHWGTVEFFKACWAWSKGTRGLRFETTYGPAPKLEPYGGKLRFKPKSKLTSVARVESENRIYQDVSILMRNNDLRGLESLIAGYRDADARTPDGYSKMDSAYWASHQFIMPVDAPEQTANTLELARRFAESNPTSAIATNLYAQWLLEAAKKNRDHRPEYAFDPLAEDTFRRQMKKVLEFLETHADAGRKDAHWHSLRVNAHFYLGAREGQFRAVVEEALRSHPRYMRIYAAAYHFYSPLSGGSDQAVDQYIKWATSFAQEEDKGIVYARLYILAGNVYYHMGLYQRLDADWTRMRKGLADMVARHPSMWNLHIQAYHACIFGDREVARSALKRIKADDNRPAAQVFDKVWGSRRLMDACETALASIDSGVPKVAEQIKSAGFEITQPAAEGETIEPPGLQNEGALPRVIKLGGKRRLPIKKRRK